MTTLFRARARGVRVRGYICPVRGCLLTQSRTNTMSFYGSRLWQQQLPMWFVGSAPEQTGWFGTAWFGREPARESGEPDPERRDREREKGGFGQGDFGLLGWRPVFVLVLLLPDDAPLITTPSVPQLSFCSCAALECWALCQTERDA